MAARAATSTAAPPLATPGRRPASRTPQPTYHEPTFRTWPPERRTCRDGTQVTIIVCEELVGGRWEPFCSIHEHPRRSQPAPASRPPPATRGRDDGQPRDPAGVPRPRPVMRSVWGCSFVRSARRLELRVGQRPAVGLERLLHQLHADQVVGNRPDSRTRISTFFGRPWVCGPLASLQATRWASSLTASSGTGGAIACSGGGTGPLAGGASRRPRFQTCSRAA
jgi:hypothetical protein